MSPSGLNFVANGNGHGRQPYRLAQGGLIDRGETFSFRFDGKAYTGHPGDSLAAALLANGVRLVARSFKYHRPRGFIGAGAEDPNGLLTLGRGGRRDPNCRATTTELFDGLDARGQHAWPSVRFDLGAINGLVSPFIPAGFYYKTFMWPRAGWIFYEKYIRKAAGLGAASTEPDPDDYEKAYLHCDLLVVGAGPSGLAAALAAGRAGARVVLVEEDWRVGGALLRERFGLAGKPGADWAAEAEAELRQLPNVRVMTRTTAFAYLDHDTVHLLERVADHAPEPPPFTPRQRLWTLYAGQVLLATGALERPLVFADNDRPGVMLASAARAYVNRYGVLPGARPVVFTCTDDGYRAALDLHAVGVPVVAVIDSRPEGVAGSLAEAAKQAGIDLMPGHAVVRVLGDMAVAGVEVMAIAEADKPGRALGGARQRIDCDLVCMSGGWNPTLHLHSQAGDRPYYDDSIASFLPAEPREHWTSLGAARGRFGLANCLNEGFAAGAEIARDLGYGSGAAPATPEVDEPGQPGGPIQPLWQVPKVAGGKRFVDFQDDVTAEDVALAEREGYRSVEHLKRYTTLGMGTDQGRTANVNGLAIMAEQRGVTIPEVGTTTFRPPYAPVSISAMAGPERGEHLRPLRRTPMDQWHVDNGAVMVNVGPWRRPHHYPRPGESMDQAYVREMATVRDKVGVCDVSTLGKIDIQGTDAIAFLNRVYCNGFKTLAVGKARYGLMLRADGMVFDDGTTWRMSERRFLMTTTTGNAGPVLAHLEFLLQTEWTDLDVQVTSVTDQWAGMSIAGPLSRMVLRDLVDGLDVGDNALPHMGVRRARIRGIPAWVARLSFSGELAYEVIVPADHGLAAWEEVMLTGKAHGIEPYGTEALGGLRIEKGHVAGAELDGRTTADDLGLGKMVSRKKWSFGTNLLDRPALQDPQRAQLVGLKPVDGKTFIKPGALLVESGPKMDPMPTLGHVTSATDSPALGHPVALALLKNGRARHGEKLWAAYPLRNSAIQVEVVSPHFHDPDGSRMHG